MPAAALAGTTVVYLVALLWMREPGPGIVCCLVALYSEAVSAPRTRALITGAIAGTMIQLSTSI